MSPEKKKTTKKAVKKVTVKKTVAKKPAVKKTTTKKVSPVKVVTKTTTKPKTIANKQSQKLSWLPWVLTIGLLGVLFGVLFSNFSVGQKFSTYRDMITIGDQTWMPVPGKPVNVVILNDKNCVKGCETAVTLDALRQNVTPALIIREVDLGSAEGIKMVEDFDLATIPQYFFGTNIKNIKADDGSLFVDNLPEGVFVLKNGLYHVNGAAVGFPTGKFIEAPEFADLDTEPTKGSGPVQIVEFTDYQCPFCKRLFDQNKDLIARLIAENKITYTVKDFPLNFHQEAPYAHKAANCALKVGGNDSYWKMHSSIFDNVEKWSKKGSAAEAILVGMASDIGVDITSCMLDESMALEIEADIQEGAKYGVTGTPALFIGAQFMPGAIGPDVLEAAVNQEAAK